MCQLYVPEAQGSLPRGASATPGYAYQPRACRTYRVPRTVWYTTGTAAAALTLTLTAGTAAASSVVRDVLELEASALRARNPSPAASAQLEDVFGNRPKQAADTIVCTNCGTQVSSNRCAPMPMRARVRVRVRVGPEASANSRSSFDTPNQRQSKLRAASSLGHRLADRQTDRKLVEQKRRQMCSGWPAIPA